MPIARVRGRVIYQRRNTRSDVLGERLIRWSCSASTRCFAATGRYELSKFLGLCKCQDRAVWTVTPDSDSGTRTEFVLDAADNRDLIAYLASIQSRPAQPRRAVRQPTRP